jgi:aminoglycoside phosphotransferase (APT) family kinase protein
VSNPLLAERLAALIDGGVTIADLKPVSGGNARKAWSFDAVTGGGAVQPCILLAQVAGKHVESDTAEEYRVLRAMTGHGLCVPAALALDADGAVAGGPALVLERIEGQASAVEFLKLDTATGRSATAALAKAIAGVHAFDWAAAGLTARSPLDEILLWESRFLAHRLEPLPALAHLFGWLKAHVPTPSRLSLVHGDLRPGNFLFAGGQVNALLDWEMAHVGDPAEDLAWAYRALWSPERFIDLEAFTQVHGLGVPRQNILFYRIFSEVKFATISVSAAASFARGDTANLRHIDRAAKVPECLRLCFHWIDSGNWEATRAAA